MLRSLLGLQEILLGCGGRKGDRYGHMKECWSSRPETSFDPTLPRTFLCDLRPPRPLLWAPVSTSVYLLDWSSCLPLCLGQSEGDRIRSNLPKGPSKSTPGDQIQAGAQEGGAAPGASRTHDSLCLWDLMRHKIWRGNSGRCRAANMAELLIPSLA